MERLASCDMCVVESALEPNSLRVKLAYYADTVKLAKLRSAMPLNYSYPVPTPVADDLQDLITILLPQEMAHDIDVGDIVRVDLTKVQYEEL